MDIYCPRCGEPWEMDTIHDIPAEDYTEKRKLFKQKGCGAIPGMQPCTPEDNMRATASSALMEVMGDDMDGVAALMEDFGI